MSAEPALESFLDLVQRSGVIAEDKMQGLLDEFRGERSGLDSSRKLADELVDREILTRWQADQLLRGKHRGFFLGSYCVLGLLGEGGMGTVYLAEHQNLRRRCAIKVLPSRARKDESSVERFYREAQAVAALDHPNIVRAYDVNKDQINETEIHYLVMEYIDGQDLQRLVEQHGVLAYHRAADYIRQAAEGLAHAHERGFVHRDVKPANLLVDAQGVVKVLDLGLARFFAADEDDSASERSQGVLGTADYLAPEQAVNSDEVDARADIYSLGQTFYYTLMGHAPFPTGTVTERILAHQRKSPAPIMKARPDAPPDLVAIIDKMTAKRAIHRYQSASEVVATLEEWLQAHEEEMRRPSRLSEVARSSLLSHPDRPRAVYTSRDEADLELAPLDDEGPPTPGGSGSDVGKKSAKRPSAGDSAARAEKRKSSKTASDSRGKTPKPPAKSDSKSGRGNSLLDELPELAPQDDELPATMGQPGSASGAMPALSAAAGTALRPSRRSKQESPLVTALLSPILWIALGALAVVVLIIAMVLNGSKDKPEVPSTEKASENQSPDTEPPQPAPGPSAVPQAPSDPAPSDPAPSDPAPSDPAPSESGPGILVDASQSPEWKWLHPADGIDPATENEKFHSTFFNLDFDDSNWSVDRDSTGPRGGFGYNGNDVPQVAWVTPEEDNDRKSAYLRHEFKTDAVWDNLSISLQYDDGVIIYLDGKEVKRENVMDGPEAYDLFAVNIVSGDDEVKVNRFELPPDVTLQPGEHVLAISLHNRADGSSDLRIAEISLHGTRHAEKPPAMEEP